MPSSKPHAIVTYMAGSLWFWRALMPAISDYSTGCQNSTTLLTAEPPPIIVVTSFDCQQVLRAGYHISSPTAEIVMPDDKERLHHRL